MPVFTHAQDFTGVWVGTLYVDSTKQYLPYEITISDNGTKLIGASHMFFEEEGRQRFDFRKLSVKVSGETLVLVDEDIIANTRTKAPPKQIKKTLFLTYSEKDSVTEVISGKWTTNKTIRFLSATGTVTLTRKRDYTNTIIYKKLDSFSLVTKFPISEPKRMADIVAKKSPVIKDTITKTPVVEEEYFAGVNFLPGKLNTLPFNAKVDRNKFAMNGRKSPRVIIKPLAIIAKTATPSEKETVAAKEPPVAISKEVAYTKEDSKSNVKSTQEPVKTKVTTVPAKEIVYVDPSMKSKTAVDLGKRITKTDKSLYFQTDSIAITLYDNGTIDGDTVTVLINGQMFIAKQGLDIKPNSKTFYIPSNTDSLQIIMYAENLGSIPPNTGLLVIRDGDKTHEVRFSADLNSNAAILLRRKKE